MQLHNPRAVRGGLIASTGFGRARAKTSQAGTMTAVGAHWAELALAIGGFGIGTGEFVMTGLLPDVASNFSVSIPAARHVISAYALGVVLGAPSFQWRPRVGRAGGYYDVSARRLSYVINEAHASRAAANES